MSGIDSTPPRLSEPGGKQARFERLAEKRVTEALHKLRLVANLANRHNYVYTAEHVRQILDVLEGGLREVKARFREESAPGERAFTFRKRR